MAKLVVRKGGKLYKEIELNESAEYTAGRDESCDIVLENIKGISRRHFILKFDGQWTVEMLSRMNNLVMDGTVVKEAELGDNINFEVYPYYFAIQRSPDESTHANNTSTQDQDQNTAPTQPASSNLPMANPQSSALSDSEETAGPTKLPVIGTEEATMVGQQAARVLHLSVVGTETGNDSIVQLDDQGPIWMAGRDPSCAIYIDDGHASRNHFKIIRDMDQFFIEDLGSANGTELNGEHLQKGKKQKLVSGDEVQIMSVTINIEVRDPTFDEQVELAEQGLVAANPYFPGFPQNPYPYPMPNSVGHLPPGTKKAGPEFLARFGLADFDWQKNKVKVAIGALVPLLLIGLLMDDSEKQQGPKKVQSKDSSSTSVTFDKLNPKQKAAVKDIYNLAKNYYFGMRYELCISEVTKLHKVIPVYEDSKQLLTNCSNGQEILIRDAARKQKEEKQKEALERIHHIVAICEENIDINTSVSEIKTCLSDAMELDPANDKILALLDKIKRRDAERDAARIRRQQRGQRMASGKRAYRKAVDLKRKDQLNKAARQFQKFLTGGYPGLDKEKKNAKRELASVRAMLSKKIDTLLNECEALRSNSQFKKAYTICDIATKESPGNERARALKSQTLSDLRKEMKSIYQDSILEESLGNVDAAKEKWRTIMKNDIESDEYYKKAKRKLKKYGEGI